jgi:hypothetical protein
MAVQPSIREKTPEQSSAKNTRECFGCYEGVVFIGYLVPTPDGDEEEVFERHRCRLCDGTGWLIATVEGVEMD